MYWPLLWFKERLYKREASTITVGKKENAYCRVQLANFKQLQIAWEELVGLEPGQEKGMKKLSVKEMQRTSVSNLPLHLKTIQIYVPIEIVMDNYVIKLEPFIILSEY